MARQKKTEQTYRTFDLYPLRPFDVYASCATTPTAAVRILYRVAGTEPPEDPYISIVHVVARPSDLPTEPPETHDLTAANPYVEAMPFLRANGWWIDSDYQGPDFAAIRVHLRTACGWSDADVTGATWKTILAVLRGHEQPANRHSEDYSTVLWQGLSYAFSPSQARAVEILWKAYENGTPDVHQASIHERIGSSSESQRLRDIFKNHPAWGTMIVAGEGKGMFRLSS